MSKTTFQYVLDNIYDEIVKVDLVGDAIPPAKRLAVCFSRLMRGTYYYDISSNYGIGMLNFQCGNVVMQ